MFSLFLVYYIKLTRNKVFFYSKTHMVCFVFICFQNGSFYSKRTMVRFWNRRGVLQPSKNPKNRSVVLLASRRTPRTALLFASQEQKPQKKNRCFLCFLVSGNGSFLKNRSERNTKVRSRRRRPEEGPGTWCCSRRPGEEEDQKPGTTLLVVSC